MKSFKLFFIFITVLSEVVIANPDKVFHDLYSQGVEQGYTAKNATLYRYLYLAQPEKNLYTQCLIQVGVGIDSNSCINIPAIPGSNAPVDMAIDPSGQFMDILNAGSSNITECAIDKTGINTNHCANITIHGLVTPSGLAINEGFAFYGNLAGSDIIQCGFGVGVNAKSCEKVSIPGLNINGSIAVNKGIIYIVDGDGYGSDDLIQCNIDNSGINSNTCIKIAINNYAFSPVTITINNDYAYIGSFNDSVAQCPVGESGIYVSSCNIANIPNLSSGVNIWKIAIDDSVYNQQVAIMATDSYDLNNLQSCSMGIGETFSSASCGNQLNQGIKSNYATSIIFGGVFYQ